MKFGDIRIIPRLGRWTITFSSFGRSWKKTHPARYISAPCTAWDTSSCADSLELFTGIRLQPILDPVPGYPSAATALAYPFSAFHAGDHSWTYIYQPASGAA